MEVKQTYVICLTKQEQPVLVFRSSETNGRVINQILSEIDGIGGGKTLFVIGATNRPDTLDHGWSKKRIKSRGKNTTSVVNEKLGPNQTKDRESQRIIDFSVEHFILSDFFVKELSLTLNESNIFKKSFMYLVWLDNMFNAVQIDFCIDIKLYCHNIEG